MPNDTGPDEDAGYDEDCYAGRCFWCALTECGYDYDEYDYEENQ